MEMLLTKHSTYHMDHPGPQRIASLINIFGDVPILKLFI